MSLLKIEQTNIKLPFSFLNVKKSFLITIPGHNEIICTAKDLDHTKNESKPILVSKVLSPT